MQDATTPANINVKVFRWDDESGDWGVVGDFRPEEGDFSFGISVTLSDDGNRVAFGTARENCGNARVYEYNAIMDWSKIGQDVVINTFNHVVFLGVIFN